MTSSDKTKLDFLQYGISVTPLAINNLYLYVSPNGKDSINNGGESNPFKTINFALRYAKTFHIVDRVHIHLANGTYEERIIIEGPSKAIITNWNNSNPIIKSEKILTSNYDLSFEDISIIIGKEGFSANTHSFISLNNVTVTTTETNTILLNISDISNLYCYNCTFNNANCYAVFSISRSSQLIIQGYLNFDNISVSKGVFEQYTSNVYIFTGDFRGMITGKKYYVGVGGILYTCGQALNLPGTEPGVIENNGCVI